MRQMLDSFPQKPVALSGAEVPGPPESLTMTRGSMGHPSARSVPTTANPPESGLQLSAVVPFYNEGESILDVLGELRMALDALYLTYEVLAVDDGSADDTGQKLQQMALSWPQLCVLSHVNNCGQAAALWTAFQKATGELVAVLDGDGQNDPSALDAMIYHLKVTNADMVAGVRAKRKDSLLRKMMSRTANNVRQIFLSRESLRFARTPATMSAFVTFKW